MAIPFYKSVDLKKHEIRNMVIQRLTIYPHNPIRGQVFYHIGEKDFFGYTGEEWKPLIKVDLEKLIDDGVVSEEFVWSSFKVSEELESKQDVFTTEGGLELDNALLKLKLRTEDLRIDENEELAVQLTSWSPLTFYKNKKIEHQGATEES